MASRIERCVSDVSDWCAARRLQLNADKTVSSAITINRNITKPSSVVRDLGVLFDVEWAVNAPERLACVTDVLLSSAPHTLSPSSTRPRRHCQAGCSFGAVAPWPLQRCSCGFAGDDTSPSTENLACSRTYCTVQDLAPRPFHSCPAGVALVADHRENTVQAVPAQDVCRARSRLHCQPVDLTPASDIPSRSSLHSSSNCDLVVLRTSRKSDV